MNRFFAFFIIFLVGVQAIYAFSNPYLEGVIQLKPVQAKYEFEIPLINESPNYVEISKETPSCSCTIIQSFDKVIAPWSSSTVVCSLDMGARFGFASVDITVEHSNGISILPLRFFRPFPISVSPHFISTAKSFSVKLSPEITKAKGSIEIYCNAEFVARYILNGTPIEVPVELLQKFANRSLNYLSAAYYIDGRRISVAGAIYAPKYVKRAQ
jgi:hypothetical protein